MARKNRLKLVWAPQALDSLREIQKREKRQLLRNGARLLAAYPEMHRLRRTRTWGLVGLLRVSPFVAVYRVAGQELQIAPTVIRPWATAGPAGLPHPEHPDARQWQHPLQTGHHRKRPSAEGRFCMCLAPATATRSHAVQPARPDGGKARSAPNNMNEPHPGIHTSTQ